VNPISLPTASGAYRWYYADVSAGDFTAVFIFMVGSIFSARYSQSLKRGGLPGEHAAVNFALYEKGARWQWVLSEYGKVALEDSGRTLRIGDSWLSYPADGSLQVRVVEKTAPWGERTEALLSLHPECPRGPQVQLVEGKPHFWQPFAPRARATVRLPQHDLLFEGRGYHDGNHGEVALGGDLRGWDWARVHRAHGTEISYRPWEPGAPALYVQADAAQVSVARVPQAASRTRRSAWGLMLPQRLVGAPSASPSLLESSPFYARLEAREGDDEALGEVADFARFHQPWVRWMAGLRTRTVRAA
jgi:carotenoid 1,2-hydratase